MTPTNNQVAETKNLRKKYDYLKGLLNEADDHSERTETESDDEESEEEEQKRPAKRPMKQRQGISAEVFGAHNKKGDFTPPVFPKSDEVKTQLRNKLLQAFMFNALEE